MGLCRDQRRHRRRALHGHGVLGPFRQSQPGIGVCGYRGSRGRDVLRRVHRQLGGRVGRVPGARHDLNSGRGGRQRCGLDGRGGDSAALGVATYASPSALNYCRGHVLDRGTKRTHMPLSGSLMPMSRRWQRGHADGLGPGRDRRREEFREPAVRVHAEMGPSSPGWATWPRRRRSPPVPARPDGSLSSTPRSVRGGRGRSSPPRRPGTSRRVVDQGVTDQNRSRYLTLPICRVGRDVVHIAAQGIGDSPRCPVEGRLQVVATQHEHDDVERSMAEQAGDEVCPPVAPRTVLVGHIGRAPVESLLKDVVPLPKQSLGHAGLPAICVQADVVRVVSGSAVSIRFAQARAVGGRVTEAQDPQGVRISDHVNDRQPRRAPRSHNPLSERGRSVFA